MYWQTTPFLRGKLDGLAARPARNPYEPGSGDYDQYAAGYRRGREVT